jgi:hypothetical protein
MDSANSSRCRHRSFRLPFFLFSVSPVGSHCGGRVPHRSADLLVVNYGLISGIASNQADPLACCLGSTGLRVALGGSAFEN